MNNTISGNGISKDQLKWFYALVGLFAILLGWSFMNGMLFMTGLPVVFLMMLLMVFRLDLIAFFAVLITPFSINLAHTSIGIGVSLPSEPLMFALFLIFWLKVFLEGGLDKRILYHPVTLIILVHLLWYTITTATSSMFVVSFKSTVSYLESISKTFFECIELGRISK